MDIWQTIKNFFSSEKSPVYRKFAPVPKINFKEIEKHGKTDGNLSIELSNENLPNILHKNANLLHSFHHSQYGLAQRYFTESQKTADIGLSHSNIDDIKARLYNITKNSDELNLDQRETEIKSLHQSFLDKRENYRNFRKLHGISLLPKNADPEQTKVQLWIFIGLFILEFFLNLGVLQAGGATAIADSIAISITQTAVNIGSCYLAGKVLLGRVIHSNLISKLFLGLVAAVHAYIILLINANMGIFRDTIVKNSQSIEALFEVNEILEHWEMYPWDKLEALGTVSILVIGMGILFAIISYIDGFNSDDPYPNYGAVYREPLKLKRLIELKISQLNETWTAQLRQYNSTENQLSTMGFDGIKEWSHEINMIEQVKDDFKMLLNQLEKIYDRMIQAYVSTYNRYHTKDKLSLKDLNLLTDQEKNIESVFSDVKDYFMTDKERLAEEEAKKKTFSKELDDLKKELKQVNESISKEIKALSTNHPTELN